MSGGAPIRALCCGLVAAGLLLAQTGSKTGARKLMKNELEAVRLPDSAFWEAGSEDHGVDPVVKKYKTSYFGVLIDGPREVPLSNRHTLPVFTYYMGSYKQTAKRDFPRVAAIVAMDPERNEIRVSPFLEKRGESLLTDETEPEANLPEGYQMTFQAVDLRERTELPWRPGRVITQVLLMDLNSNRLETRLVGGSGTFVDPEKEKFLAEERAKKDPPAPFPAVSTAAVGAPPVPEGMGITLAAPRVMVLEKQGRLELSGAWRLPVLPEELVKPAHAEYNQANGLMQKEGGAYAACIGLHLVVMSSEGDVPTTYTLRLPVAKVDLVDGRPVASGRFTVDLQHLPDFPLGESTLFLYAYGKEWASEPATIGVVDRRQH
jgi:hypothetical protein